MRGNLQDTVSTLLSESLFAREFIIGNLKANESVTY